MSGRHAAGGGKGWVFLVFLLVALGINLLPFVWMVVTSLRPAAEIEQGCPSLIPQTWTTEHYRVLLDFFNVPLHLLNSLLYAGGVTLVSLGLNSLAGFAFACLQFPGRERLFALLMMTMMVPLQVTILPVFLILKHLGLLNTLAGLILPGASSMFGIFLLRQFMRDLPEEILEQGRLDGCSEFDLYWRIVLPLSRPILATLAVFTFIAAWNDFLGPLIVMLRESGYPLPVALANLSSAHESAWGLLMAGTVLTILPGIVIFLLAQRHYLKGITAGAVR